MVAVSKIASAGAAHYIRDHWKGRHSLFVSFWINLVLLRAALFSLEALVLAKAVEQVLTAFVYIFLFDVLLFVWQAVGVVRSCDRFQTSGGSLAGVWGVQLGIVVSLLFTSVGVFTVVQHVYFEPEEGLLSDQWERERTAKYEISLSRDGAFLHLNGSFELGVTKKVTALLRETSTVKAIVLASPGGNTYEGRGVAKVIRDRGLDTYVVADCFSACTLAFIAGVTRTLGPNGKLGFHQYGLDVDYQVPFLDIEAEQRADRTFFESQMIEDAFLAKIFDAPQSDLWIPSAEELLESGVVHRLGDVPAEP